jgi:hypothetical protein
MDMQPYLLRLVAILPALCLAALPQYATAASYDLAKGGNKPGNPVKPLMIKADKVNVDFQAEWTWTLQGIAVDSKSPPDTVDATNTVFGLNGLGAVPIEQKKTVKTAWAEGQMDAQASFTSPDDLLGEPAPREYEALVRVLGSANTAIRQPAEKGDWAFAMASSSSVLNIFGIAAGGGKVSPKPFKTLGLKRCLKEGAFGKPGNLPAGWPEKVKGCKGSDPISVQATNLADGQTIDATLFSYEMEGLSPGGSMAFEDGLLTINTSDGRFTLDIPGIYTSQKGSVFFEFANGIVTRSDADGQFASLLPGVGMSALGSFDLGSIELDYDFGWGDHIYSVNFGAGVSDQVAVYQIVPEPGSWALMLAGFSLAGIALRRRPLPYPNRFSS